MTRTKLYAIIAIIVLACVIGVVLYTQPRKEQTGPETVTPEEFHMANITGTVTDEDTELPIEGAKVKYYELVSGAGSNLQNSTTTDSDGVYLFTNIPYQTPKNHSVTAHKAGYDMKTSDPVLINKADLYTVNFALKLSPTSVYLEPSEIILNTDDVSVGDTFTVTVWISDVTDLMGFQVPLYYDASVINLTSVSLPADHVLAGQTGMSVGPFYTYFDSWEVGFIGFTGLAGATPFNGTGKLAVFEFEIIAEPPGGGSLTSDLVISYTPSGGQYEIKLNDSARQAIGFTATDGSYELIG